MPPILTSVGTMDFSMKRKFNGTLSDDSSSSEDETDYVPPPPKKQYENNYSTAAMAMMSKMGYKGDTGLGKAGQGRLEPIEASTQKGRRGFGLFYF